MVGFIYEMVESLSLTTVQMADVAECSDRTNDKDYL